LPLAAGGARDVGGLHVLVPYGGHHLRLRSQRCRHRVGMRAKRRPGGWTVVHGMRAAPRSNLSRLYAERFAMPGIDVHLMVHGKLDTGGLAGVFTCGDSRSVGHKHGILLPLFTVAGARAKEGKARRAVLSPETYDPMRVYFAR
jgi:hypothetical protein